MSFTGKIGDTLRLQDTGARHRYIILTKPNNNKNVVIVNFTTAKHHEWFLSFSPKDNKMGNPAPKWYGHIDSNRAIQKEGTE